MNLVANIKFVQAFSDDDSCPKFLVQQTIQQTIQDIKIQRISHDHRKNASSQFFS
jgi:hypothetical protein